MKRDQLLSKLQSPDISFDFVIIGGGATGLGVAVDAASRGYSVALFEQSDFTKATSSRSTKLVHGGVRYLQQGDVSLVLEALRERGLLRRNAPHLVRDERFLIPCYRWWEGAFYTIGLTLYDLMAGSLGFGRSFCVGPKKASRMVPGLRRKGLMAGVIYHDGQFDDSRLAINLVRTAVDAGAVVLNYMKVTALLKEKKRVCGVTVTDQLGKASYNIKARAVINATGVFADSILNMDNPEKHPVVRPSQGVHLVLDRSFLGSDYAVMIPKTSDGRVLFAVPWHNRVVVGTTDTVMEHAMLEPVALEKEINFILKTAGQYLTHQPQRSDVLSVFAGLRPLAAPRNDSTKTKEISRSHKLMHEKSGLVTIIGGKWTTYRKMAEDTVNYALAHQKMEKRPCVTEHYLIHGAVQIRDQKDPLRFFGTDASEVRALIASDPRYAERLHPGCDYTVGEVLWIIRNEMPQTVEDVLARRLRILFLDARAAMEMAPRVAAIMATEMGKDEAWRTDQVERFDHVASHYLLND